MPRLSGSFSITGKPVEQRDITLNSPASERSQHWLQQVRRVPTTNCNNRPPQAEVNLLVIHNISLPPGQFGGGYIEQLFTNCLDCDVHPDFDDLRDVQVSSHLLIDREGQVTQFVPFNLRAWHAGVSSFNGRDNCNDFSIGIELEGTDHSPYTERQYHILADVTSELMQSYRKITVDNIVGHSDIAPGRKTDPGPAFDWDYFRQLLAQVQPPTE